MERRSLVHLVLAVLLIAGLLAPAPVAATASDGAAVSEAPGSVKIDLSLGDGGDASRTFVTVDEDEDEDEDEDDADSRERHLGDGGADAEEDGSAAGGEDEDEEVDASEAQAQAALATHSEADARRPHTSNPNFYVAGTEVRRYPETWTRRRYVQRAGRWYRDAGSNWYYENGSWHQEKAQPSMVDPTVHKVAGAWVKRPATPEVTAMFLAPNKYWYRNQTTHEYFWAGKWGHMEKHKRHPTNPHLHWLAGHWQKRASVTGSQQWVKKCGKFFKRPAGNGVDSFTFYRNGKWHFDHRYARYRNNPYYYYSHSKCTLVRLHNTWACRQKPWCAARVRGMKSWVVKAKSVFKKDALPSGGFYFRSPESLWFYKDLKWRKAPASIVDPRYKYDDANGKWLRKTTSDDAKLNSYVFANGRWWSNKYKTYYWYFGKWVHRTVKPYERLMRRQKMREMALKRRAEPFDLDSLVKGATDKEFAKFTAWFLKQRVERAPRPNVNGPKSFDQFMAQEPPKADTPYKKPVLPMEPEPGLNADISSTAPGPFNPEGVRGADRLVPTIRQSELGGIPQDKSQEEYQWPQRYPAGLGKPPGSDIAPVADSPEDLPLGDGSKAGDVAYNPAKPNAERAATAFNTKSQGEHKIVFASGVDLDGNAVDQ